jgi:hypothetical protein
MTIQKIDYLLYVDEEYRENKLKHVDKCVLWEMWYDNATVCDCCGKVSFSGPTAEQLVEEVCLQ